MAMRAMKKARGSRVMRVMMETSPREEGDNGHNNRLGTKVAAMVRTVVATTARAITTAARVMATGAKRATATMATTVKTATTAMTVAMAKMVTMMPNRDDAASGNKGNKDTKQ